MDWDGCEGRSRRNYGDDRVTEVGRYLDAALEAIFRNAAE
jgi:hypothetical protein